MFFGVLTTNCSSSAERDLSAWRTGFFGAAPLDDVKDFCDGKFSSQNQGSV